MRSLGCTLIQSACYPYKKGTLDPDTGPRGECHLEMKAWICVLHPDARKLHGNGQTAAVRREAVGSSSLRLQKDPTLGQLDLRLLVSRTVREHVSLFKPPHQWCFVRQS